MILPLASVNGMHPLHGMHEPSEETPARRPASIRRTATLDMTRPEGISGPVVLVGAVRDLFTDAAGSARTLGTSGLLASVDYLEYATLESIATDPDVPALQRLVGQSAMGGFRAKVDEAAGELREERSRLYLLLDDVPVGLLICGHALSASGEIGSDRGGYQPIADRCAGFVSGGLLMSSFEAGDPAVVTGPPAPDLGGNDADGWHAAGSLTPHDMRRRRRIDVRRNGEVAEVDAIFRDTYVRSDGVETVIHEYTLTAAVDIDSRTITSARAVPRVLPWQECPGAVASAGRVEGMRLRELHDRVRSELVGTSTCTHLNDMLRSVADVDALIDELIVVGG